MITVLDEFQDFKEEAWQNYVLETREMKVWYDRFAKIRKSGDLVPLYWEIQGKGKVFEVLERLEEPVITLLKEKHEDYEVIINDNVSNNDNNEEIVLKEEENNNKQGVDFKGVSKEGARYIWNIWDETQNSYLKEIFKTLSKIKENRYYLNYIIII